jgi:hypothetical protein
MQSRLERLQAEIERMDQLSTDLVFQALALRNDLQRLTRFLADLQEEGGRDNYRYGGRA